MQEGASFISCLRRERNRRLAEEAKRIHGVVCQACGFCFRDFYSPVGDGYNEARYVILFHTLPEGADVRLSPKGDFAVVRSTWHRMLHRDPCPSVAELRDLVRLKSVRH